MKINDSYVWGLVFLGLMVSNFCVLGLLFLRLEVRDSYFWGKISYVWGLVFVMFGGYFSSGGLFSSHRRLVILTFGGRDSYV